MEVLAAFAAGALASWALRRLRGPAAYLAAAAALSLGLSAAFACAWAFEALRGFPRVSEAEAAARAAASIAALLAGPIYFKSRETGGLRAMLAALARRMKLRP